MKVNDVMNFFCVVFFVRGENVVWFVKIWYVWKIFVECFIFKVNMEGKFVCSLWWLIICKNEVLYSWIK